MEKRINNKIGKKYWRLAVLEKIVKKIPNSRRKDVFYKCLCDCGNECEIHSNNLKRNGGSKSCGCNRYWGNRTKDLTGQKFNMLTAIRPTEKRYNKSIIWLFKCDCGNEKELNPSDVLKHSTKSCGCLQRNPDREESVFQRLYLSLPAKSRKYGGDTDISFEDFVSLSKSDCFYCGKPPSNCAQSYGADPIYVKYTGLDRINSSIHYLRSNVRPCCKQCNQAKSNYSEQEYCDFIKRSYEALLKKGFLREDRSAMTSAEKDSSGTGNSTDLGAET